MLVVTCLPFTSSFAKENLPPMLQQQAEHCLLKSIAWGRMGACDHADEPQCQAVSLPRFSLGILPLKCNGVSLLCSRQPWAQYPEGASAPEQKPNRWSGPGDIPPCCESWCNTELLHKLLTHVWLLPRREQTSALGLWPMMQPWGACIHA